MNPYPGVAPLTVHTSGVGAPGVLVSSGSSDPHGWWPTPSEATGNDARTAANLMAAIEALTDRSNFSGWRTVDWIRGGDYHALFTGSVTLGNQIALLWAGAGIALTITAASGSAIEATAGGSDPGARLNGAGGGPGAVCIGGSAGNGCNGFGGTGSNCVGVWGNGDGSASGVQGSPGASSDVGVWANGGAFYCDTNFPRTSAPGLNHQWANSTTKARGSVTTTGSGATFSNKTGYNFDATCASTVLAVTFNTALASGQNDYDLYVSVDEPNASNRVYQVKILNQTNAGFSVQALGTTQGGSTDSGFVDFTTKVLKIRFQAGGQQ